MPQLWRDVTDARHTEHATLGAQSRENRRADEACDWVAELIAGVDLVAVAVGLADPEQGEDVADPRDALVQLIASAASWVDAMDGAQ